METKQIILFICAAVVPYLVCGINPAILLSSLIYHKDIRTLGSKNPGFTNFKRVFGGKYAWLVFALDIGKAALVCALSGIAFSSQFGLFQLGAAYAGFFAMLGHCYPIWYGFKGGKGFLVGACAIWFIDWRVGAVATAVLAVLIFTLKYMSVATLSAGLSCPIMLALLGTDHAAVIPLCMVSVLLMFWRHKANIIRLCHGTEPKFNLFGSGSSKADSTEDPVK